MRSGLRRGLGRVGPARRAVRAWRGRQAQGKVAFGTYVAVLFGVIYLPMLVSLLVRLGPELGGSTWGPMLGLDLPRLPADAMGTASAPLVAWSFPAKDGPEALWALVVLVGLGAGLAFGPPVPVGLPLAQFFLVGQFRPLAVVGSRLTWVALGTGLLGATVFGALGWQGPSRWWVVLGGAVAGVGLMVCATAGAAWRGRGPGRVWSLAVLVAVVMADFGLFLTVWPLAGLGAILALGAGLACLGRIDWLRVAHGQGELVHLGSLAVIGQPLSAKPLDQREPLRGRALRLRYRGLWALVWRDLLGMMRRPWSSLASVVLAGLGLALVVSQPSVGLKVVGLIGLYLATAVWTRGLGQFVAHGRGLAPWREALTGAVHLVVPVGLMALELASVAWGHWQVLGLGAAVLAVRAWVVATPTAPAFLSVPAMTPMGDFSGIGLACWYLRGPLALGCLAMAM